MSQNFDLAVIGGGTAGISAAITAAELGAKVALIEANRIGGEYLWGSGIMMQTLARTAKVFELTQRSEEFGVHLEKPRVLWTAVKLRIEDVRDTIRGLQREKLKEAGVEIIAGHARFADANTLEIEGKGSVQSLRATRFIIATGSKVVVPEIEGLEEAGYKTYSGILSRTTLPKSMVFIGGGSTAASLAQTFQRLGAKVSLLESSGQLLPHEEPEVSAALETILRNEGVDIRLNARILRVSPGESRKVVEFEVGGETTPVEGGEVLIGATRAANLDGLRLESIGVKSTNLGIGINPHRQTSVPHIYACGTVTGTERPYNQSEIEGRVAARNALGQPSEWLDVLTPTITFTDPEVAHVGDTVAEVLSSGQPYKVLQVPFKNINRAIIDGETSGFARLITDDAGRLLGAHIIGPEAGELMAALAPPVSWGNSLKDVAKHGYASPTLSDIIFRLGQEESA